jgi:hypothetical protein
LQNVTLKKKSAIANVDTKFEAILQEFILEKGNFSSLVVKGFF